MPSTSIISQLLIQPAGSVTSVRFFQTLEKILPTIGAPTSFATRNTKIHKKCPRQLINSTTINCGTAAHQLFHFNFYSTENSQKMTI
jgi:hypothetical protein